VETALVTAMRAETDRSVLLELIFDRLDPRPFAAIFLETVIESSNRYLTSKEGLEGLNKDWTVCVLRKWWMHSNLVGADTSWGMGKAVARLLNISSLDMEDPETMQLDFPAQTMTKRLQTLEQEIVAGTAELQHHPTYLSLLSQFSPRAAIYTVGTTADGLSVETNNEAFSMLFQGADRRYSSLVLHKTLPSILFLALVAPDDRREWSRFIIEACTRAPVEPEGNWRRTRIFKLVGAEGLIQLYLVEARPVPGLGRGGLALILEPCPPSRHLAKQSGVTPRLTSRVECRAAAMDAVDEKAAGASPSEVASAWHKQRLRVGRRENVMGEGCSSIKFPGIAVLPFSGSPGSSPNQHLAETAEQQMLNAFSGFTFPLMTSFSSDQDDADRDKNKLRRGRKVAAETDHVLQSPFSQPSVNSGLAPSPPRSSLSSSVLPSSSLDPSPASSSSSSLSVALPSPLPPHFSSETKHHYPIELGDAGVGAYRESFDTSEWGEPPPVLDDAMLTSVFCEGGEDAKHEK
jgi:hypothetical protein